ncbi:MAG: hypothetical protein KAY00_01950 [Agitococcus sp.]|nr:hypothetical protein [Agitococcus sp.]
MNTIFIIFLSIFVTIVLLPMLVLDITDKQVTPYPQTPEIENTSPISRLSLFIERFLTVLLCYALSILGIFGSAGIIQWLAESSSTVILAWFLCFGWLCHVILCVSWVANAKISRFFPVFYLFVSISCTFVPMIVFFLQYLVNVISYLSFIDYLAASLGGMLFLAPNILLGIHVSYFQLRRVSFTYQM